jgi:hypothetical protein
MTPIDDRRNSFLFVSNAVKPVCSLGSNQCGKKQLQGNLPHSVPPLFQLSTKNHFLYTKELLVFSLFEKIAKLVRIVTIVIMMSIASKLFLAQKCQTNTNLDN